MSAYADEKLLGKWVDKATPKRGEQWEFSRANEFACTNTWIDQSKKQRLRVTSGIWETGSWEITKQGGITRECVLFIYAGTDQCCFAYKFIGENLIFTSEYSTKQYGSMCKSRVLVRAKKK